MTEHNIQYEDIANHDVQDKRSQIRVPFPPRGNLHCYVPFYFWGRTPMLLVNQYRQNDIIFFVTHTETVARAKLPFAFTDRHAIVEYAQFYNDLEKLDNLDWQTIKLKYWANTPEDPARREKKQAEFLIHQKLPWEQIYGIAVYSKDALTKVESAVAKLQHKPVIRVTKEWYYQYDTHQIG